jgi:uncharacterized membrane protein
MNTPLHRSIPVQSSANRAPLRGALGALACLGASLAIAGTSHAQVTLEYLSAPPGDWSAAAYGCSANGLTGAVTVFAPRNKAVRWNSAGDGTTLAVPVSTHSAYGWSVSGDGVTVLGWSEFSGSGPAVRRPLIWRGALPPLDLGNLPGMTAGKATASNYAGTVIVGSSEPYAFANTFYGFRWTIKGGMVALPGPGGQPSMIPTDISDSGDIICGIAANVACRVVADLDQLTAQSLGVLPGMDSSIANAVSGDGTMIVGSSSSFFDEKPFKWTSNGGMVALPLPSGFGRALDASSNGSTIVGERSASGGTHAAAWTTNLGFVNLNTYLDAAGVSRGGDTLSTATGVSRDGRVIVGFTDNGKAFRIRNFNAPPPVPGDLDGDGIVDSTDLGIILSNWGGSGAGDLNGDGVVDSAALGVLLSAWT